METAIANRLISARKMAGLSLQSLAEKLGNVVTKQALNKYEQGKMKPNSELIIALSNILNVPVNYFYSIPSFEVEFENIDFRRFSSRLSSTHEESIKEKAKDLFERYFELESILNMEDDNQYFEYPLLISNPDEAEKAAKKLRKEWDLGYDPIADVVEMLEDKGYKVIEVEADGSFDGFKADIGNKKVIVLRKIKDGDDIVRKRFTALHELAHHVLKFPEELNEKEKEREKLCHVFACALLYPEEMARKEMQKDRFHFYLNELELIKSRWGISFTAIFNRALHLGIINPTVYKKLNIGYKSRYFHLPNNEPGKFLGKEKPVRMERMVYYGLGKEILTINEAAYYAGISSWRLRSQIDQLV
jgi:Zn-dependent peptidase ImmA (M78 family)/DNA-binding XRE family transcriptional regulator